MAETLERLEVEIDVKISELKKDLERAKAQFNNFGKEVKDSGNQITGSLGGIGKAAAAAFSVKEIISFGKECLDLASDLQEVQNVVDVTFGDMSGQIDEFAANAKDSFGLSEKAAKQFTGTMGAMLKSSGLSTEAAYKMSTNLTALSADLASFYNLGNEEAFTKVRSGISGETEPLKQLGINMSVANMEAYAMAEGITKSYDSMTQAEQAILRYNYLVATTSAQQGDFARTSGSWANQTKALSMSFDELKASIGTGLIELFTPLLEMINDVIKGLQWIADKVNDIFGWGGNKDNNSINTNVDVTTTDTDVNSVANNLGIASTNAKGVADGLKSAKKEASELKRTVAGFDEANVLADTASGLANTGALKDITSAAGDMATAIKNAYDGLTDVNDEAGKTKSIFGDVSLSAGQIKSIVAQIVGEGKLKEIETMTNEMNKLDDLRKNLQDARSTLASYQWMVKMGFEVNESDYKAAVDNYIKASNDYVTQQHKVVQIAAQFVYGKGSDEEKEINKFYDEIEGQLGTLSKQIKDKVNEAWEDGMIDIDEQDAIDDLIAARDGIINGLNQAEVEVGLTNLKVDFKGVALTSESYQALMKELNDSMQKESKTNKDKINALKIPVQYKFDKGEMTKADYDAEMAKLDADYAKLQEETTKKYAQKTLEIIAQMDFTIVNESMTNLNSKIQSAVDETNKKIKNGTFGNNKFDLTAIAISMKYEIDTNVPQEVKDQVAIIVSQLAPTEEQLKKIRDDCKKAGEAVPDYVSKGISDIEALKAMTGDIDAIYYLAGTQISDNPEAKKAYLKAKAEGKNVPDSFVAGMDGEKVDISTGVNAMIDEAMKALNGKDTKTKSKKAGNDLMSNVAVGVNNNNDAAAFAKAKGEAAAKAIANSGNLSDAKSSGKKLIKYAGTGINNNNDAATFAKAKGEAAAKAMAKGTETINSKTNKNKITAATYGYWNTMFAATTGQLNIKDGKSKLFGVYADNTVKGYNYNINNSKNTSNSKSAITTWVSNITTWFKGLLGIHSPSDVFEEFADFTTLGFNNQIYANIGDSKKAMQSWGSNIAKWGNDFVANDFGNIANASIKGNMTADITGSIANAVKTAMDSQNNTFYATVNIGGEKHVAKFVKTYNQMHGSNPDFGFAL